MTVATRSILGVAVAAGFISLLGAIAVYSGVYNVAADEPHTRGMYALLETARVRSIAVRADALQVPADLDDQARIRQGAGNYAAMCAGCHLAPGEESTELSKGLYPAPPDLTRNLVSAGEAFWVIKHGIKASGMPAWGKSMGDDYIWNLTAFVQRLPKLDRPQYDALVAASGGHSHGGGETGGHAHGAAEPEEHDEAGPQDAAHRDDGLARQGHAGHDAMSEAPDPPASNGATSHTHADGRQHVHAAADKPRSSAPAQRPPRSSGDLATPTTEPQSPSTSQDSHEHRH
ncbi:c-type cytochrome [Lysobacter capsici]|uniref:c-type cytochrome n=1 Tax=Lysobacter capsici TaxID=435897 RepID=UPI001BFFDC54|nr:cytochrome c [Lysobacter capsici]QWF17074.1 cytochrome c [Lysobacter capsici]